MRSVIFTAQNRLTILQNGAEYIPALIAAIDAARIEIYFETYIFALDGVGHQVKDALKRATERGVEVTILLGVGEFWLQDSVTQSFYPKMLKRGVKLYEYRKTQLHAKVAVIDDVWSTVGSSNVDAISLFINQEANVVARDAEFARALRAHIEVAIADSTPIHLDDFANRPWYKRAWYGAAFMLYRGMMRIITLGDYT